MAENPERKWTTLRKMAPLTGTAVLPAVPVVEVESAGEETVPPPAVAAETVAPAEPRETPAAMEETEALGASAPTGHSGKKEEPGIASVEYPAEGGDRPGRDEVRSDATAILVAHPVASTARLIRDTLEQFTGAQVQTTADPLRAFELALQRPYGLFYFAMQVGELSGPMLYELISKAWSSGRGPRTLAPAVIFVREKDDPRLPDGLERDVRVRDVLSKPIRIERLLESVRGVLEVRDPTRG